LFEEAGEDGSAAGLGDVAGAQGTLDDELVGAPIPDADDGGAEEDAGPGEVGVGERSPEADVIFADDVDHFAPAAELVQADEGDGDGAADEDEGLEQVGIEDGAQAAEDGVDAGDDDDDDGAGPEVNTHE